MITYAVEVLTGELIEELKPTLLEHWKERPLYKDKLLFNPNYEAYLSMQENGSLQVVIVRDEGILIGYSISLLYAHPHYQDNKIASNDVLYIHPDYRGKTVAYRMMKFAEKELQKIGCSVSIISMKTDFPFERLCKKLGMDKHEISYLKYIGEQDG